MAEERWDRCKICGLEWPDNALAECPQYRNSEHRKRRTNVRGQDVMAFVKTVDDPTDTPGPDVIVVTEKDISRIFDHPGAEPAEGALGSGLWPLRGKKRKEPPDAA